MPLRKYRPTSAGLRTKIVPDYAELKDIPSSRKRKERKRSVRSLVVAIHNNVGRNNQGRITSRFRGGGHKKLYRIIDFLRSDKAHIPARVNHLDYDPYRNCWLALLVYADGEKRYIICPDGVQPGTELMSGPRAEIRVGNSLPLVNMPLGSVVHNLELTPGRGAQLVRTAGQSAQLIAKERGMAALRLPSGESRWFSDKCYATLGKVCNSDHFNQSAGKAGRTRWQGRKPHNRGVVMNPVDHKHGGGEGKCPVGADGPYTFAGKKHGLKTRKPQKSSSKHIISRRKK